MANLAQITIQRIDIVLVAIILGPADAAIYTAATRFLVAGQFANSALSQAAQPRFAELFAVDDRRGANVVYRATTAWLVVLTWPLYLLAVIYGPEILSIFGHSYRAGDTVMVILGLTMLVATACGQVDMVLITTGRSSWSLANGLMAVVVNVTLDVLLIPRYGITGAAIGWAVAIIITNLIPLAQLAASKRLNPFGRGTFIAIGLAVVSFAVIPLAVRAAFGPGAVASLSAVGAGCLVQAGGLWRFRDSLRAGGPARGVPRLPKLFQTRGWPEMARVLLFLIWPVGMAVIFGGGGAAGPAGPRRTRRAEARPAAVAGVPRGAGRCGRQLDVPRAPSARPWSSSRSSSSGAP